MQKWSPRAKESKNFIFRPVRHVFPAKIAVYHMIYFGRYRPGNGRVGRKIKCLDSLARGDPFCTLEYLQNSFCDDSKPIRISVKSRFSQYWSKMTKNRNFLDPLFLVQDVSGSQYNGKMTYLRLVWTYLGPWVPVDYHLGCCGIPCGLGSKNDRF